MRSLSLTALRVLLVASGVSFSAAPAIANVDVCSELLSHARQAYVQRVYGPWALPVLELLEFHGPEGLNPSSKVQHQLFTHLLAATRLAAKRGEEPLAIADRFVRVLERYSAEEIEIVADALDVVPTRLLDHPERAIPRVLRTHRPRLVLDVVEATYTWLDGWRVSRLALEKTVELQEQLQREQGLQTVLVPHRGVDGSRLVLLKVLATDPQRARVKAQHALLFPFSLSQATQDYLERARMEGGMIAIDPFFEESHPGVCAIYMPVADRTRHASGARWIIGLQVRSPSIYLEHEWQHKLDANERRDQFESQLVASKSSKKQGLIGSIAQGVEYGHYCEVIATQHEMDILHGRVGQTHDAYQSALTYYQSSLRAVAFARILQEPFKGEHYRLWLRSFFTPKSRPKSLAD